MSRRIVLWRHGRTEWNEAGWFQGQTDVALDDTGRQQAREAAARLASLDPDLLLTSDLERARDTAGALAAVTGLDVEPDPRLRETYAGVWQGLTTQEIRTQYPDDFAAWRAGDTQIRVGGGETRREVAARMVEGVEDAAKRLDDDGLAVLATHGGAARNAIASLIGMPLELLTNIGGLSNCSWSMLRQGDHGWALIEHNAGTLPEPVVIEEG